jgi:hypothetical protein
MNLKLLGTILLSWEITIETSVLKSWETKTHDNENVLIELSRNSGGYKVAVDFNRACVDFDGIVAKYFADSTYQAPFFDALKVLYHDILLISLNGSLVFSCTI